MRKLDFNEYKLAQMQARIFEESIERANFSSPMFIRRFMTSYDAKTIINKSFLAVSKDTREVIEDLNDKYQPSRKSPMYSKNQMYWIGYIFATLCFLYELSPKAIYKLFPAKEIVKYYNIYHTFDVEDAAERMMENINYVKKDYTIEGVKILKRLIAEENKI